ncbi:hypothetical protein ALQ37_200202 [Pseudomonas syringae pv. aptata]|uniref:Uncharacterized protein n=1 Tax=Pseudomonas syringae pv. aptata TaxID=83167 RepID=A0A0Q0FC57_PSEAP|nr:hypothetical protein [Pseudomonas syringae]KPY97999.1 putative methyltransferase [Pseudomonas syringae pv. aptata]RMO65418.1 hypothetical protein ALQ37_200202 [Pseudomonas syringae pv. aptata]
MNDLKNQIVNLKKTIFKITKNVIDSDSKNQTLAFKCFVQLALHTSIHNLTKRFEHHGLSPFMLDHHLVVGEALIQYEGRHEALTHIDESSLIDAVNLYNHIVKKNEPFTDVLSLLAEEITISKKQAKSLGQYMTPPDLARAVASLLNPDDYPDKPTKVCDFCVGYGALILGRIEKGLKANPKSLRHVEVIVNDIDPFMSNVTALQIITNTVHNNLDIKELVVLCSDVIKDYRSGNASFVIKYRTPQIVLDDIERIHKEKALAKHSKRIDVTDTGIASKSVGAV